MTQAEKKNPLKQVILLSVLAALLVVLRKLAARSNTQIHRVNQN